MSGGAAGAVCVLAAPSVMTHSALAVVPPSATNSPVRRIVFGSADTSTYEVPDEVNMNPVIKALPKKEKPVRVILTPGESIRLAWAKATALSHMKWARPRTPLIADPLAFKFGG